MSCPTPEKMRFGSRRDAKATIKRRRHFRGCKVRHAYLCRCGYWHMTSHTAGVKKAA